MDEHEPPLSVLVSLEEAQSYINHARHWIDDYKPQSDEDAELAARIGSDIMFAQRYIGRSHRDIQKLRGTQ